MLICPHCEFENPDSNKFCQSCGTPLQQASSLQQEGDSALQTEKNLNNPTTLWAIITKLQSTELENGSEKSSITTLKNPALQISDLITSDFSIQVQVEEIYLDAKNRYRISANQERYLTELTTSNPTSPVIKVPVIDGKAEEKTTLLLLQEQQPELLTELAKNIDNSYQSVAPYWNLIGVPTQALPYLVLQRFTPIVPQLYDAWQYNGQGIIVLPNRSHWQLLTELWAEPELPFLQILWFLNELAKLWIPLTEVGCCQSLLIQDNLRLDEDQSLCLQQLYLDPEEDKPTLKTLAQTWQVWLRESGREPNQSLAELIEQVIQEKVDTVEQLSTRLQQISTERFDISSLAVSADKELEQSVFIFEENELEDVNNGSFFDESDTESLSHTDLEDQPTLMLPMQLADVTDASCTDIGTHRDHNEDFFGVKTEIKKKENAVEKTISASGLYLVCDGMGGHAAGEVASAMAVNTLEEYFKNHWLTDDLPDAKTIETGILLANQTIYQTNIENSRSGSGRMGTTMVMALLKDTNLAIAHVGDSRIYLITRQRGLEQLTQDHEVGQREINRGVEPEIAYGRPDAYQLTQALGPRENRYVKPEIKFLEINEDSLLLLCSDGLSDNNFLENHWETYLTPLIGSSANLEEGLFQLIDFANQYNGHDNITGVLVRIKLKPNF